MAAYGLRSALVTLSTMAGSTSSAVSVASSRVASRDKAAYGSSRSPYMTRFTSACSRARSGANATAASPAARSSTVRPWCGTAAPAPVTMAM